MIQLQGGNRWLGCCSQYLVLTFNKNDYEKRNNGKVD